MCNDRVHFVETERRAADQSVGGQADRRRFFGSATLAAISGAAWAKFAYGQSGGGSGGPPTPIPIQPFQAVLPVPPVLQPLSSRTGQPPFVPGSAFHGIAPEFADVAKYTQFPLKYYTVEMKPGLHEFIPGVKTPVWAYNGIVPGPTIRARIGEPIVVRFRNRLTVETSVHLHGGHNPSSSDGNPIYFVDPGKDRDYFYPNTVPLHQGKPDYSESISTTWYHDHAMDVSGPNVYFGLSGLYLSTDHIEDALLGSNVLPRMDVPLVLSDRRFNANGTLYYDMLDHDGAIGDIFLVNGKVQPRFQVQRRKYRFRILNGSNARYYDLRFSDGREFLQVGNDSWLLPYAMPRESMMLSPAKRADIIVDFSNAPSVLYLNNWMAQSNGRKPDGTASQPTPLMRFDVVGNPVRNDAKVVKGTLLRPHTPILASEIQATRVFEFGRSNGSWVVNNQLYDPNRIDATPKLNTAERWIFNNGSGGWWHPIHVHLESHQVQSINGQAPPLWESFKSDTVNLANGTSAEVFMKFRTFKGPFVFHCHNVEHEDMRMMMNFNVVE
jgi:FtsP/CotA-like multicopper oxidase with cupredoxin domain